MDDTDREAVDYLSMVPVDFFFKGKLIFNVTSFVYPQFVEGQTFEVDLQPTNRERARRPAREYSTSWFIIDKVRHKAYEPRPGLFAFKIEVLLKEADGIDASDAEIDTETRESAIHRRLLKRS